MTTENLTATLELRTAQRDAALEYLQRIVASRKGNDYGTSDDQAMWRGVRALLAEAGR